MIPFHSHTLRRWLTVHFSAVLISLAALSAAAQTPVPAHAFTAPATKVTGTNALLNGAAMANGSATTAWFEWGTSPNYGFQTESLAVGDGNDLVWLNAQIQDLTPGQVYHFRLAVSNEAAVVYGADQVFALGKKVWSWGELDQGVIPGGLSNVTAIAAGGYHSLALREDTTVFAWGCIGDYWHYHADEVPVGLTNVIAIAAGGCHSLALKEDGRVIGWGENNAGQCTPPEDLTNVVAIAAGLNFSLALKGDGTVVAWGDDHELAMVTTVPAGLSNVVAIAAGWDHCLAIRIDGTVKAWGNYNEAQTDATPQLTNIVAVSCWLQNIALRADGTVLSWGGPNLDCLPPALHDVIAVASGCDSNVALTAHGTVFTWRPFHYNEAVTQHLTNAFAISAGPYHNLALGGNQPPRVYAIEQYSQARTFLRDTVRFSARVEGTGPFAYQWKKGTNALVNNARISGASTPNLTIAGITLADAGPYTITVTNLAGTANANAFITVLAPATRPYHGLFSESSVSMETAGALRNFIITPNRAYTGNLILNGKSYTLGGRFDGRGSATQTLNVAPHSFDVVLDLYQYPGIGSFLSGYVKQNNSEPTKWVAELSAIPAGNLPPSSHWVRLTSSGAGNSPRGSSMGLVRVNGNLGTLTGSLPDGTPFSISVPVVSSPSAKDGYFPVHARLYNGRGMLTGWAHLWSNQFAGNLTWIKKPSAGQYPRGFTNQLHIETLTPGIRR